MDADLKQALEEMEERISKRFDVALGEMEERISTRFDQVDQRLAKIERKVQAIMDLLLAPDDQKQVEGAASG